MFAAIVLDSFSSSDSPTFTDYIHVIRALLIVRLQEVGGEHLHGKTRLSSESCQARVLVPSFSACGRKGNLLPAEHRTKDFKDINSTDRS
jgi:hypothetical protein